MTAVRWTSAVPLVAALLACGPDSKPDIAAPQFDLLVAESGPSAGGHGEWVNAAGEHVSRSFHGHLMPDGSVQGDFTQFVTSLDGVRRRNKSTVDCLLLLGPTDAMLSGVVEENVNPALVGLIQIFRVIDDGEGVDAVDQQSALVFRQPTLGVDCRNLPPPAATPIEGGNIQVRP